MAVIFRHPTIQEARTRFLGPYVVERRVRLYAYASTAPIYEPPIPCLSSGQIDARTCGSDPGRRSDPPPDPVLVDGEEHYEVEAVLDSRIFRGRLQYLIQWKGYSYEHNSWENATDVRSPTLVAKFYSTHPGAPVKYAKLTLTTFLSDHPWTVTPSRRSLEGG